MHFYVTLRGGLKLRSGYQLPLYSPSPRDVLGRMTWRFSGFLVDMRCCHLFCEVTFPWGPTVPHASLHSVTIGIPPTKHHAFAGSRMNQCLSRPRESSTSVPVACPEGQKTLDQILSEAATVLLHLGTWVGWSTRRPSMGGPPEEYPGVNLKIHLVLSYTLLSLSEDSGQKNLLM